MYLYLTLFILICWFISYLGNNRTKKVLYAFSVFALGLVMGLRDVSVGIDTKNYYEIINYIIHHDITKLLFNANSIHTEPGYNILIKLCALINTDYYFIQIILSMLLCSIVGFGIWKLSPLPMYSLIIFLPLAYLSGFNIYRQILACAILFSSWYFLINKNLATSLLLFAIAIFIHYTSLIFILAYISYYYKNRKFFIYLSPIFLIFFASSYVIIINYIFNLTGMYSDYIDNRLNIRAGSGNLLYMYGVIILTGLYMIYNNKFKALSKLYGLFSLIYVTCSLIGLEFNYFERMGIPFLLFTCLIFPIFSNIFKNKTISNLFIGISSFFFIYLFLVKGNSPDFAYKLFF